MKKKLIILTTAIIRGDYHLKSIGKFYVKFNNFLEDYDVHHIINIDSPKNLKSKFSKFETIDLFNKIIPNNINKEYIINDNPGFIFAFTNLMNKIKELNLLSKDNYYWWFEDDWKPIKYFNIFKYVNYFCKFRNSAIMFTDKSPLGSFRGGPIMSGTYFMNFFNIVNLNVSNNTCDPERQVRRWLSGINRMNGRKKVHRVISNENNKIQIVQLIIHHKIFSESNYMKWYYPGKYFNKNINFEFTTLLVSKNLKIFLYDPKKNKFNEINNNKIVNLLDNDNIKYFNFYPDVFKDIGRKFNEKNKLEKWSMINHGTKYLMNNNTNLILLNKLDKEDNVRLDYDNTFNDNFYKGLLIILHNIKLNKDKLNIKVNYYSHKFGLYPNFDVFNNYIFVKQEDFNNNEDILCKRNENFDEDYNDIFNRFYFVREKIFDEELNNIDDNKKKIGILGEEKDFNVSEDLNKKNYKIFRLNDNDNDSNYNNIKLIIDRLKIENDFNNVLKLELELKNLSNNNLIILKNKLKNLLILNQCDIVYCKNKYLSILLKKINKNIIIKN